MNEQTLFQTMSQISIQLKANDPALSDADAVSKASILLRKIVNACKQLAGSNTGSEGLYFHTISQIAIQNYFRNGKTDDESVSAAQQFVESMKVEAATIANS